MSVIWSTVRHVEL